LPDGFIREGIDGSVGNVIGFGEFVAVYGDALRLPILGQFLRPIIVRSQIAGCGDDIEAGRFDNEIAS